MSINGTLSKDQNLECGLSQGSVLGAMMYIMYADDTQIYIHCNRDDVSIKAAKHKLQECIADVCLWINNSTLRLNEAKTECIILKPIITNISNFKLKVGTSLLHFSN